MCIPDLSSLQGTERNLQNGNVGEWEVGNSGECVCAV